MAPFKLMPSPYGCCAAILSLSLLTACGGGGGGGGSTTPAPANMAPSATFTVAVDQPTAPATVTTDASASSDSDGNIVSYDWDFAGTTASGETATTTFTTPGSYTITLTVTDDDGASATATRTVQVDAAPVTFTLQGTVRILNSTAVDSDVHDRLTTPVPNNSFDAAQPLLNPVVLGGWANVPNSGVSTGNFFNTGDPGDFYQVSLTGGEAVTLYIAENDVDLDLRLYDAGRTLIDASLDPNFTNNVESLDVAAPGTYFVEVLPFSGGSNYVLLIGQDVVSSGVSRAPTRLSDPFVGGELLVKAKPSRTTKNPRLALPGMQRTGTANAATQDDATLPQRFVMADAGDKAALPASARLSAAAQQRLATLMALKAVARRDDVAWAEPNLLAQPHLTPDDSLFQSQWHYNNINLPLAWDTSTGSTDVIAAVIDTGVLLNHPDLQNQLVPGYDFISDADRALDGDGIDANPDDPGDRELGGSSSFHGTHVAGTVAAQTDNGTGVAGASWQTRIMPLRVLGRDGGTTFDITQAIRFAAGLSNNSGTVPAQPADVLNLSLGTPFRSQSMQDAVTAARQAGLIVVASAGNDNTSALSYPAALDGVVSVAATTISNQRAGYSNFGSTVDVAAPGGSNITDLNGDGIGDGVISTIGDDEGASIRFGYGVLAGTSMAAPHVAGVIALMKAVHPALTPAELDLALTNGDLTDDLGAAGRDDQFGHGLLNAQKAVLTAELLASGTGSDPGPVLTASTTTLNFGAFVDELTLTIRNIGTGTPTIDQVTASEPWVSAVAPGSADGLGDYTVRIDRTGLPDGAYQANLTFTSAANDVTVSLIMQVSSVSFEADAGLFYVILVDENGNSVLPAVLVNASGGAYAYEITDVPAGTYRLFAGTDTDDDELLCDSGEACGAYPTLDSPQFVTIEANATTLDFESVYRLSLSQSAAAAEAPEEDRSVPLRKP